MLVEGLLSDAPDPVLLHTGVPSIYCDRMTEANLGAREGGMGRYRACARLLCPLFSLLLCFFSYLPIVYTTNVIVHEPAPFTPRVFATTYQRRFWVGRTPRDDGVRTCAPVRVCVVCQGSCSLWGPGQSLPYGTCAATLRHCLPTMLRRTSGGGGMCLRAHVLPSSFP